MHVGVDSRPLMPQELHMQSFAFAPPNLGVGDNKKNYVFVDEHNRHKRLKVMRACEGCRRRKIKCDAATTNTWPCGACVRLKLQCVPPSVNYDRIHGVGGQFSGLEGVLDFDRSSASGDEEHYGHPTSAPHMYNLGNPGDSFGDGLGVYGTPPYTEGNTFNYDAVTSMPITVAETYQNQMAFQAINSKNFQSSNNEEPWGSDDCSADDLSKILGELKIDETGIAPYISQQKNSLAKEPAQEEFEIRLPAPATTAPGSTVRIPPELMPSEEQCMEWFEIFFAHIHPYVPVLSKSYFYRQWRTNRTSISPLMLEAIFACAGRMSDDPAQGAQWLALASKHEDCFMDVPRLSTIQALLLLLKARESAPKRGYYYRSWMTVKTLVTMAKDLELHEHYANHQANQSCESEPIECLVKTRIWQTIFVCEMMIGGPQGRFDMGVDPATVDFDIQRPQPGIDDSDYQISRQFLFLVRNVRNVRHLHYTYGKVKKQKDWASNPQFAELNNEAISWQDELPRNLQVDYPDGDAPPWVTSHYVGNIHSYYHLNVIMVHRPQLMSSGSFSAGGSWKKHMVVCYDSAKKMCRLQEAVLNKFGLSGLLCMQRGINFVIYSVLTCTMIHLVAITSPDPEFNTDAKEYFTRHMRILENCTSAWPMPEMQASIDALREAFSADTTQPFRLRSTFPYGSPGAPTKRAEPPSVKHEPVISRGLSHEHVPHVHYSTQPLTPPVSAGLDEQKNMSLSLGLMSNGNQHSMPVDTLSMEQSSWNPTRIFDQWNNAFGTPTSTTTNDFDTNQPSPPYYTPPSIASNDMAHVTESLQQQQQQYPMQTTMAPLQQVQPSPPMPSYSTPTPSFVTSSMWRDTVANSYDTGALKRHWDMESAVLLDSVSPKRMR